MFTQGWDLSGLSDITPPGTAASQSGVHNDGGAVIEDGFQIINSTLSGRGYPAITVQAGTPVKWVIDAPQGSINGCNNRIFINEYGIEYTFKTGENIIEFTPLNTGTFRYSCWMGMIRSTITVAESRTEGARYASTEIPVSINTPAPTDNTQESDSSTGFESLSEPIPANVTIPTDTLAIAEVVEEDGYKFQKVMIELTDEGLSPAVAVVQSGLETMWVINNNSSQDANFSILVPAYKSEVWLDSGENPLYFFPAGSFDFSNANNQFYGYMKVVDNLNAIDRSEIKKEAENYQTIIWPSATFKSGVSCH
jgi:plastocyanin domain-containing protein